MGKKKGRKKSKGEKKKKKATANEFETLNYEQQITENNKQLARLRSRNDELETHADKLKQEYKQLNEDRADVIAHLKKLLENKTRESQDLQKKVNELEKTIKDEQLEFKKKETGMTEEFKIVENGLNAELKMTVGRLNALEDWRLARVELMQKFEDQEKRIAQQEVEHREKLYAAERKLVTDKAKMQDELERRLSELAQKFREAAHLRLGEATHRALRENAAQSLELKKLLKLCQELDEKLEASEEAAKDSELRSSLMESEVQLIHNKLGKLTKKIRSLADSHAEANVAITRAVKAERLASRLRQNYSDAAREREELKSRIRDLELIISKTRETREICSRDAEDSVSELDDLAELLMDAKNCVREALELRTTIRENKEEVCDGCVEEVKDRLLHSLLNILASPQPGMEDGGTFSEVGLRPIRDMYEFGNLGLIPSSEKDKRTAADSLLSE